MSSEARLQRLGLAHLAGKPKALAKELEKRVAEGRKFEEEVVQREMDEIRRRLALQSPVKSNDNADDLEKVGREVVKKRAKAGLRKKA